MKKVKNGKIELLRFIFSFLVVLCHTNTFLSEKLRPLVPRGGLAVEFFLLLSGYFMAATIHKRSAEKPEHLGIETQQFLLKKVTTLMPNYLIALAIAFAVTMAGSKSLSLSSCLKKLASIIWEPLFLSMAGFGTSRVNGVDWYISSMLLVMLVLYPLCRRYTETFTRIVAPALSIFIIGYFYHEFGTPLSPTAWMGLGYRGFFRSLAMLCAGIAVYPVIFRLSSLELTNLGKGIVSLMEVICWLFVIGYLILARSEKKYDYFCVLITVCGTVLSLSHQGFLAQWFDNRFFVFLGKFSLSLYLSHLFWGRALGKIYPQGAGRRALVVYLILAFTTSAFVYIISEQLKKNKTPLFTTIRKKLLK